MHNMFIEIMHEISKSLSTREDMNLTIDEIIEQIKQTTVHLYDIYRDPLLSIYASVIEAEYVYYVNFIKQVIDLLEELKKRRDEDYGYLADTYETIGYNKGIDDFTHSVKEILEDNSIYNMDCIYTLAEQLKVGEHDEG